MVQQRENFADDILKDFSKELNKFEDNLGGVTKAVDSLGKDGLGQLEKGLGYLSDIPGLLLALLEKLFGKVGSVLYALLIDGIVIIAKLIWLLVTKIWKAIEKTNPTAAFGIKIVGLMFVTSPFLPSLIITKNVLAKGIGNGPAMLLIGGGVTVTYFLVVGNWDKILTKIGEFLISINYIKIVKDSVLDMGPELAKFGSNVKKEINKIF